VSEQGERERDEQASQSSTSCRGCDRSTLDVLTTRGRQGHAGACPSRRYWFEQLAEIIFTEVTRRRELSPALPDIPPDRSDDVLLAVPLVPEEPVDMPLLEPPAPIIVPVTCIWWPTCCARSFPSSVNVIPADDPPDALVVPAVPDVPEVPEADPVDDPEDVPDDIPDDDVPDAAPVIRAFVNVYVPWALRPALVDAVEPDPVDAVLPLDV